MKLTKSDLFKRQTTLIEVGEEGQQKLQSAKVLVVGCGGLGSPIAVYLATSGIGKLHLVDFDTVSVSNLHRQVFYSLADIGKPKAVVLTNFIKQRAPFTEVSFTNLPLTKANVLEVISDYDIVVDGTDSLPTKYLINDACVLKDKPLVYGSLYKFDGYVATFNVLQEDGTRSPNLRDAFPKIATDVPNCEEAGTLNPIVAMIASQQVNEVLKLLLGIGKPLKNTLLIYNLLNNSQLKMKLKSSYSCHSEQMRIISKTFEENTYFDTACETQNLDWQISPSELKKKIENPDLEIVAVLPNLNLPFKVHQTIPIQEFDANSFKVSPTKTYVMVCQRGFNSYKATKQLKEKYPNLNVLNLEGGITNYIK